MLNKENTVFILVDVQGKLAEIVYKHEELRDRLIQLIKGLKLLDIPMVWLEQYPKGLGQTSKEIAKHMPENMQPISKMTFNACENNQFVQELSKMNRKQIIIAGIEAHICVYQTAVGLISLGYEVEIVQDAVSSRTKENKQIGLEKMKSYGMRVTSVEMVLYELMKAADTSLFKKILPIVK